MQFLKLVGLLDLCKLVLSQLGVCIGPTKVLGDGLLLEQRFLYVFLQLVVLLLLLLYEFLSLVVLLPQLFQSHRNFLFLFIAGLPARDEIVRVEQCVLLCVSFALVEAVLADHNLTHALKLIVVFL